MVFGRRRRELEEQLEVARRELTAVGKRCTRAEAELTTVKAQLDAASTARDAASAERDELRAALTQASAPDDGGARDRCWSLLLADLERRWPQPPGSPSGAADDVAEQLSHALAGELERLREEVGVDAEVTITTALTPAQPTVFLLTALDLIGALTSICERVVVALDDELRLTGRSWEGRREELDQARTRALAAGAVVTPVEIADDEVRLTLLPTPPS